MRHANNRARLRLRSDSGNLAQIVGVAMGDFTRTLLVVRMMNFTDLRRRRDPDRPDCWFIYCGDIHAGTIAKAVGMPNAFNNWNWSAGFYPGSRPGETKTGCADSFEEAKAKFEAAWLVFASTRTENDYQEWRDQRDWTARKYAARDQGKPVPVR
jgi:hypothetical protein